MVPDGLDLVLQWINRQNLRNEIIRTYHSFDAGFFNCGN